MLKLTRITCAHRRQSCSVSDIRRETHVTSPNPRGALPMPGAGIWRTKSVEQSMAGHRRTRSPSSSKDLTAWDLTVFGVAVVIGAGIFTLTARAAGNVAGPSVSLAFVLAAIACGLAALCYAEFASTVPVAGQRVHVLLRHPRRARRLDHRLGPGARVRARRRRWSPRAGRCTWASCSPVRRLADDHDRSSARSTFDWGALLIIAVHHRRCWSLGTKLSARVNVVITAIKVARRAAGDRRRRSSTSTPRTTRPFIPPAEPRRPGSDRPRRRPLF